ncbi:hypothetical protein QQA20_25135 [Vibrio parahaemolyticus]|nr:hypothetical protein [Vibrio parahaemolyticus]MDF4652444.1 hypothetical protein [Vibrio parahaemolyticus]MDG3034651.1 hypothetical protein [Vibrio parahaemolyticus]MDK9416494.1 hypothetical protein [Vibrio parahaemolyticus]MDK9417336.1 hypothetical protein [Vibrio parahaemolyticus]MDK9506338.1 hypothetical protein [Vibrio parahaemolyticus]
MEQMKKILMLGLSLLVFGCSNHLTKTSYALEKGMSKSEVIQKMGLPDRRSMRGDDEALQYSEVAGFGQCSYIVVWLSSGEVTAVTSRSGSSVAGCGLGSKEVDWGQVPSQKIDLNVTTKVVEN